MPKSFRVNTAGYGAVISAGREPRSSQGSGGATAASLHRKDRLRARASEGREGETKGIALGRRTITRTSSVALNPLGHRLAPIGGGLPLLSSRRGQDGFVSSPRNLLIAMCCVP